MRLLLLCQALGEFPSAAEAPGGSVAQRRPVAFYLWQGGSKGHLVPARCPQILLPLGLGPAHLFSGVVLMNLATGPPTGSFPVEKSQYLPQDQSGTDQGKHLPCPESLSPSPCSSASRELSVPGDPGLSWLSRVIDG